MSQMQPEMQRLDVPSRIADLGFSISIPASWQVHELPPDEPKFDQPAYFIPLLVCSATTHVSVVSVAARPAYEDGAVSQWLAFLAAQNGYEPSAIEPFDLNGQPAVHCQAIQQSDAGAMMMRLILLEDGKRLVNISAMSPLELWSTVSPTLRSVVDSFKLSTPRGSTAALQPAS